MNETRRAFRRYAAGLCVAYLVLVLVLNHTMLVNDQSAMRVGFYLLVMAVPVGVIGAWRVLERTHRGEIEDEAREGVVLFLTAAGFAGGVWGISSVFY